MGGLEVVDPRYVQLWERARAVLGADERVVAVELGGSVASGTADRWSDLDIHVIASDDSFLRDWPSWLSQVTPTVFARTPIAPFLINTITDEGLVLDIAVGRQDAPMPPLKADAYVVGMLSGRRFSELGPALEYAVAEQLRGLTGPFITLLQRDEHMRHLTGVPHLLGLLTTVFLAETGVLPPGKHWNETFTPEQRAAVADLPALRATRTDIIAFGLGLAQLLISRSRPLYPRYEIEWPADLAHVTASRLRSSLDLETEDWLY